MWGAWGVWIGLIHATAPLMIVMLSFVPLGGIKLVPVHGFDVFP